MVQQRHVDHPIPCTPRASLRHLSLVSHIFVFLLAAVSYLPSLWGDFVFDDTEAIVNNADVNTSTSLYQVFQNDFWGTPIVNRRSHKSYRPFTILTYRLNFWASGGLHPPLYHLTNILLHPIVTLAYMFVCRSVVKEVWFCGHDHHVPIGRRGLHMISFISGLLFAVHPIHTECVASIVGRAELTAAFCFFTGLLCYIKACQNDEKSGAVGVVTSLLLLLVTILLSGCAMLFKEQGITILGVCCAYDLLIKMRFDAAIFPMASRQKWVWFAVRQTVLVVAAAGLLWGRYAVMATGPPTFQRMDNPASFAENWITRFINYQYLYSINLWLLLHPFWLCFDWSMGCVPLIESATDPRILCVMILWAVLGGLIFFTLFRPPGNQKCLTLFSLALLIIPFLPSSNLLFRVGFVVAERVLYLPSAGYCLLLGVGCRRLHLYCGGELKASLFSLATIVLVLFVTMSVQRSFDWISEESLFVAGARVCPLNAKVHYNIAKVLADKGLTNDAEELYRKAVRLYPDYDQALNNLGNLLKDADRPLEAESFLQRAVNASPEMAAAWMNLGIVQTELKKFNAAEISYHTAVKHRRRYPDAYYNLGNLYIEMRKHNEAIVSFRQATALQPHHINAWSNLGLLYQNLKKLSEAESVFKEALVALPNHPHLHYNLGIVLGKLGKYQEGESHLLTSIHLSPNNANYYANLGVVYHLWKDFEHARNYYQIALKMEPGLHETRRNLDKLLKQE